MKLETKRLILRKPKISDWKDVLEGAGNLDVSKNTKRIPYPYNKKDAINWIKKSIEQWDSEKSYNLFIELKSEKKMIGCISLSSIDKFNGTATTGSWINKKYWRKRYITEAKIAANEFAFNKLKLRRLNSEVFIKNKPSNKTQKRMGYRLEGMKRKSSKSLAVNKINDTYFYGLLKEDWKKNIKKIKRRLTKKLK